MIKAVLFDIDGVLLDSFEANLKWYQDLMAASGYRPPTREEFPPLFHLTLWDGIKALTQSTADEEIKRIWEMGRTKQVPYPLQLLKTPAGAQDTIKILAKLYQLAIVTSRVQESVYSIPVLANLRQYFQIVVAYQDTKQHKPHPDPLLLAAKNLEVAPERTVYIGDVENDVKAGKAAGMKVIIYSANPVAGADACVTSFTQLPQCIALL